MTGKHRVVNSPCTTNPKWSWIFETADPKLSLRVVPSVVLPCYHSNIRLSAFRVVKPKTVFRRGPHDP